MSAKTKTTVGFVDPEVLQFTAGADRVLDQRLVAADCIGTAAHVTTLARLKTAHPILSARECQAVIRELADILQRHRAGRFDIALADQDVHLAVERALTRRLGDLGKKVHTGRSRNDQVAVDLRLYARDELLAAMREVAACAQALLAMARRNARVPMVGRTHQQPAMPSSVGLWAAAHAESLVEDLAGLRAAYDLNNQSPLGAAASYGVPLPLDRALTARLLGFARPCHTVLYAVTARGKLELAILAALNQVLVSLSRLAQDLIMYGMPEFGYFAWPAEYCTGSSIMPQKKNPDVLELVRARAATVMGEVVRVWGVIHQLPYGYNRDVQETKEALVRGFDVTRPALRIMARFVAGTTVNAARLRAAFTPDVFATDAALDLVAAGTPFRDAYQQVKERLAALPAVEPRAPAAAIANKTSLGAPGALELAGLDRRCRAADLWARREKARFDKVVARLLRARAPARG